MVAAVAIHPSIDAGGRAGGSLACLLERLDLVGFAANVGELVADAVALGVQHLRAPRYS